MNIIKIDMDKIQIAIQEYMTQQNNIIKEYPPIILMNKKTLSQIQEEYQSFFKKYCKNYNLKSSKTIFGCHIAIADWLPFGEVQLR